MDAVAPGRPLYCSPGPGNSLRRGRPAIGGFAHNPGMAPHPHPAPVLLTGFAPFAEAGRAPSAINPSWQAVKALQGEHIEGHPVVVAELPTVFGVAQSTLWRLIRQHQPALVICVGQAGGRSALSLERTAVNVDDASQPDNQGRQPVDVPVVAGGPVAYFSTLPIKAMREAVQAAGVAAEISQTAGTFVCNHVFYSLMHALAGQQAPSGAASQPASMAVRGGFIHVPYLPTQGVPHMQLDDMVRGLRVAIATALTTPQDRRHSGGGATH